MKTTIMLIALLLSLSSSLMADFLRVEMGAGVWKNTPTGTKSYTAANVGTALDTSEEEVNRDAYIWAYLKHPVPLVPNLRLEYVKAMSDGKATGTFEDFVANGSDTQMEITQYDIIPYYNLLDNTAWVTLDVGVDFKIFKIAYDAENVTVIANPLETNYSESESVVIPLLYLRSRFEVPATGIGLEADAKYMTYSDSKAYDVRVKIDYTFEIFPILEPAIEVGYRVQKFNIDDEKVDGVIDIDFSGFYAGVIIRF